MENTLVHKSTTALVVGFAGSRHGTVQEAAAIVCALAPRGASFLVGCAPGVDHVFRQALVPFASRITVHCAFPARARNIAQSGLPAICKVGNAPSAAAALHRRTVAMVADCTHLILVPDDPKTGAWGRGSSLAFRTAVQQHKPVFVVTAIPPQATRSTRVTPVSLCGIVSGYLVVPASKEAHHAA